MFKDILYKSKIIVLSTSICFACSCNNNEQETNTQSPDSSVSAQTNTDKVSDESRAAHLPTINPIIKGKIVKNFNDTSTGLYIASEDSPNVIATANGKIIKIEDIEGSNLNTVYIEHSQHIKTVYHNLSDLKIEVGQDVNRWDVLGTIGIQEENAVSLIHYQVLKSGECQNPKDFIFN